MNQKFIKLNQFLPSWEHSKSYQWRNWNILLVDFFFFPNLIFHNILNFYISIFIYHGSLCIPNKILKLIGQEFDFTYVSWTGL